MEVAIRWSPVSTPSEARFLIADVVGHSFKHCVVSSYANSVLQWEEVSRIAKVPAFRAFDWSPSHDIVAVGQWSGETTVLGLTSGSQLLSLPIKSQRQCNAVSLNRHGLLATGLERVRNDFCLNVYDVNQRISSQHGLTSKIPVDPIRKLATSEGITSIKFFGQQPNTLVAGVRGTCVRVYDLRESMSNPSCQYQTTCVHNIAIDPTDENYFASAGPQKDTTVLIWDRRSSIRPTANKDNASLTQDGPILELKNPFEDKEKSDPPSTWSLRFSSTEPGCLGILSSKGHFRLYRTKKDYIADTEESLKEAVKEKKPDDYVQFLGVSNAINVERSSQHSRSGNTGKDRKEAGPIVSFDFTNVFANSQQPCAITLRGNQDVGIYELRGRASALAVSSRNMLVVSRPRGSHASSDDPLDVRTGLTLKSPSQIGSFSESMVGLRTKHGMDFPKEKYVTKLPISDALLVGDAARRRCLEGYLFDCSKNISILKDDADLQSMWEWMRVAHEKASNGDMVSENTDFSYIGVHGVWNHKIGRIDTRVQSKTPVNVSIEQAITTFAQTLGAPAFSLPQTTDPDRRKLCLYVLGFGPSSDDTHHTVEYLAESGDNTQACLLALMFADHELAFRALQVGPRKNEESIQALSMAITAFSIAEEGNLQGERKAQALQRVKQSLGLISGPYATAIAAYITTGDWAEVLSMDSLSLRFRVGIAMITLDDVQLGYYLTNSTDHAVRSGHVQGLVLTGLSDSAIELFEVYIERTSDLQTAVLALSFACPCYVRDARFDGWRQAYRSLLNTWKLYILRVRFDTQSTKLSVTWDGTKTITPQPAQVTLRCNKCGDALHRDLPPDSQSVASSTRSQGQYHNIFGDTKSGTVCPKCRAHLPRCVICDHWLGVPNPRSAGASADVKKDPFSQHLEICMTCRHMYHRGEATEWFTKHSKCPAPGCECKCNDLD